jgi:adenylosuccinate synthase
VGQFDDLPKEAQQYVRFLEEVGGVPISIVGVGPAREQSLVVGA